MIPLNYHHLYYFHVIAREGSIAKACHVLFLAQPTLSAQLRQLEKALGVELFKRVKQRLQLTPEGRFVLDYTESIFEMGQEMQDALRDRSLKGKVHIQVGAVNGTPRAIMHALLECLMTFEQIGHVRLKDDRFDVLLEELRSHQIDALLSDSAISGVSDDFENHLIAKIPVVFVGSRSWVKKVSRAPRGLAEAPMILPLAPNRVHEQVMNRLSEWKIVPTIAAEIQDLEVVRRLVISGHGIAPINAYSVHVSKPAGGLCVLPLDRPLGVTESVYLVTRKRQWQNPAVHHVLKHFRLPWGR